MVGNVTKRQTWKACLYQPYTEGQTFEKLQQAIKVSRNQDDELLVSITINSDEKVKAAI